MLSPDEIALVATIVGLFTSTIAATFLIAGQSTRSAWITIAGGGIFALPIELVVILKRIDED